MYTQFFLELINFCYENWLIFKESVELSIKFFYLQSLELKSFESLEKAWHYKTKLKYAHTQPIQFIANRIYFFLFTFSIYNRIEA